MKNYTVIDIETTGNLPWEHELVAVGVGQKVYRPDQGRRVARHVMSRDDAILVAHTNYDLRWLCLDGAVLGEGTRFHDTKVMAWLLDGTQELSLDALADKYLGYTPAKPLRKVGGRIYFDMAVWLPQVYETHGVDTLIPIEEVPWDVMRAYNLSDLETTAALYDVLKKCLIAEKKWALFVQEEAPFSHLLIEMEAAGMPFDRENAKALLADTVQDLAILREDLAEATGAIDFNPGSGDQVARFLYAEHWQQKVRLPVGAKVPSNVRITQTGRLWQYGTQFLEGRGLPTPREKHPGKRPTVSGKILNVMYGDDPWVSRYVAWRKADKLRGYLVDWIARCHEGRLHGRFDQSGTVSGRLAAREPNLQQVAKESDVRTLFRGDLVVGDYGNLEARLGAHFSEDPTMIEIFETGQDLYGVLASRAWGGPPNKDNENRNLMKTVWLASQYGAKGETLSQTMAINGLRGYDAKAADAMLQDMMNTVPRLFEWREEVIWQARKDGYVTTLAGRKRKLADIRSAAWERQYRAERQAVSSLIQGSAADVVRRAMLEARARVAPAVAFICLQVHDEIIWNRGPEWDDDVFPELVDLCENDFGFDLIVPLTFEATIADSWAAKDGITLLEEVA